MQFIPTQAFDVLILLISAIGIGIAVRRIQSDFKKGPRFPEEGIADRNAAVSTGTALSQQNTKQIDKQTALRATPRKRK